MNPSTGRLAEVAARLAGLPHEKQEQFAAWLSARGTNVLDLPIVRAVRTGSVPLSFAQRRIWLVEQMQPGTSQHNIPSLFQLEGDIDRQALVQALHRVVERHEALRTTFVLVDEQPRQVVHSKLPPSVAHHDISREPQEQREASARRLVDASMNRSFDLEEGPLLRIELIVLSERRCWMLLMAHHIVMDEWSIRILGDELIHHYRTISSGVRDELPSLGLQYPDFAVWQTRWLGERSLQAQLGYWEEQLGKEDYRLALPFPKPVENPQSERASSVAFEIDSKISTALAELGRRVETTTFTVLLAAFHLLLSRMSGLVEVRVGTPIANRNRHEVEGLIGFFSNTLILRSLVRGELSFVDYLKTVRKTMLEAQANQDLPFEQLVDVLRPRRSGEGTPLFDVMFSWHNDLGQGAPELPGIEICQLSVQESDAKFDLVLHMTETDGELSGEFLYREGVFRVEDVRALSQRFELLCREVSSQPTRRLATFWGLDNGEIAERLELWNRTEHDFTFVGLHRQLSRLAQVQPQKTAAQCGDEQMSYVELNQRANELAARLQRKGGGSEQRIGVCVSRSLEWLVATFAVLKRGAAYVPLDVQLPPKRLAEIVEDSGLTQVICDTGSSLNDLGLPVELVVVETRKEIAWAAPEIATTVVPTSPAYVMYTSGSTGRPKGVVVTHGNAENYARSILHRLCLPEGRSFALVSTLNADLGNTVLFGALYSVGVLHIVPEDCCFDADKMGEYMHRFGIDVLKLAPSHLSGLLQGARPERVLPRDALVLGGESLDGALLKAIRKHGQCRVFNHYGPTETTVGALTYEVSDLDRDDIVPPLGTPLANQRCYVLDVDGSPVPNHVVGELCIAGEGLARGYLNRADLTAERFIPNPYGEPGSRLYRTGDLARYLPGGNIEFRGRVDDQVKLRGHRIELGEIRARLTALSSVSDAYVLLQQAEGQQALLIAYLVAAGEQPSDESVIEELAQSLSRHMIPSGFVWLDTLPVTPNGKVDRQRLPVWGMRRAQGTVLPRNATEREIAATWQAVLAIEEVGIHENFFGLGGDSLLAFQVIARLRKQGIVLSVPQLFSHQTIAELAQVAELSETVDAESQEEKCEGDVVLAPIQKWFFAQHGDSPQHHNQSVLLALQEPFSLKAMEGAMAYVSDHHDALRLRFEHTDSGWRQWYAPRGASSLLEVVDLRESQDFERDRLAVAQRFQRSFDLREGPLFRAVWFERGGGFGRLLLLAHHLVVDGVSWRILLEDLESSYSSLSEGREVFLLSKTDSYQRFSRGLAEFSELGVAQSELSYWREIVRCASPLPRKGTEADNTQASRRSVSSRLTVSETARLLTECAQAYRTRVDDLLLSALTLSLSKWQEAQEHVITLEGHGRNVPGRNLDFSRTVGWFTSVYPVRLISRRGDVGGTIKSVKESLRRVPHQGSGFGAMRYGEGNPLGLSSDEFELCRQVTFNYLGQFDQSFDQSLLFRAADESTGDESAESASRGRVLEFLVHVEQHRLQVELQYSENLHEPEDVEVLCRLFMETLREVIAHCSSGEHYGVTPSDFPLVSIHQSALDEFFPFADQIEDMYPLTPIQEGILFHCLMDGDSGVYLTQRVIDLEAELDIAAFEGAWAAVIETFDVLRTGFTSEIADRPVQVVHRRADVPLLVLDISHLSAAERELEVQRCLERDRQAGFDVSAPPLMRLHVLRTGPKSSKLLWTEHHLLLDGWSCFRVLSEVLARYEAILGGENWPIVRARPYRDYVGWLLSRDLESSRNFWKGELYDVVEPTMLTERRAADAQEAGYGKEEIRFGLEESRVLREVARNNALTLNTLTQGALALALAHYTGRSEVVFGITVAGRGVDFPGVETMVGLFINTLPLRVKMQPGEKFIPWLRKLQEKNARLREHEHLPLAELQSMAALKEGQELFDTLLVFENYPIDRELGSSAESLGVGELSAYERTNYPVTLEVGSEENFCLQLDYHRRKFSDEDAQGLLACICKVLEKFVRVLEGTLEDRFLGQQSYMDDDAWRKQLIEWNDTEVSASCSSVPSVVAARAVKTPEAVAVSWAGGQVSYGDLEARARRVSSALYAAEVRPGDRVALLLDRSVEAVVCMLAIWMRGAAYVPIDPAYPTKRIEFVLEDARPKVVISNHREASFPGVTDYCIEELLNMPIADDEPPCLVDDALRAAYCIYTSGSTGQPKGVVVAHGSLMNFLESMRDRLQVSEHDVFLGLTTLSFDISGLEIWLPLLVGGKLVMAARDDAAFADRLLEYLEEGEVSVVQATPTTWQTMTDAQLGCLSPQSKVLCGGEPMPRDLARRLVETGASVFNVYGPTETTIWSTLRKLDPRDFRPFIGRPLSNTRTYVLGEMLQPVAVGTVGELFIGGLGVADGYWDRPALTAERFQPDPFSNDTGARMYRTGDLARFHVDGTLECLGRVDGQVKINGHRIELSEIEATLRECEEALDAAVSPRQVGAGGTQLVAYVVRDEVIEMDEKERVDRLKTHLLERLPDSMVPRRFVFVDDLPKTPNGKLHRAALPDPERDIRAFCEPATSTEKELARIWGASLGIDRIGATDDFFELGGDSIVALRVVAQAKKSGLSLSPRDVFEYSTIQELGQRADQWETSEVRPWEALELPLFGVWKQRTRLFSQRFCRSLVLELHEPLHTQVVARALRLIEERHEMLRTRLHGDASQAFVSPARSRASALRERFCADEESIFEVQEQAHQSAAAEVSWSAGVAWRCTLVRRKRRTRQSDRLLLTVHRGVADLASLGILAEDLMATLDGLSHGSSGTLGENLRHSRGASEGSVRPFDVMRTLSGLSMDDGAESVPGSTESRDVFDPLRDGVGPATRASLELGREETARLKRTAEEFRLDLEGFLILLLVDSHRRTGRPGPIVLKWESEPRKSVPGFNSRRTVGVLSEARSFEIAADDSWTTSASRVRKLMQSRSCNEGSSPAPLVRSGGSLTSFSFLELNPPLEGEPSVSLPSGAGSAFFSSHPEDRESGGVAALLSGGVLRVEMFGSLSGDSGAEEHLTAFRSSLEAAFAQTHEESAMLTSEDLNYVSIEDDVLDALFEGSEG